MEKSIFKTLEKEFTKEKPDPKQIDSLISSYHSSPLKPSPEIKALIKSISVWLIENFSSSKLTLVLQFLSMLLSDLGCDYEISTESIAISRLD